VTAGAAEQPTHIFPRAASGGFFPHTYIVIEGFVGIFFMGLPGVGDARMDATTAS
jgi:hypothetical protein